MTSLSVERCDPRERADQIIDLFARHGQPEFARVFDRVYRPRAEEGLRSWVGLEDGRAMMHISVSPVPMTNGRERRLGGVLGDLMVDETRRNFWTALQLVRTMVTDVEREGSIQFLVTTTVTEAASVFHATGFRPLGEIRRFVLPLNPVYLALSRLRAGARPRVARSEPLGVAQVESKLPGLRSGFNWRPLPSASFYGTRIPRHEYVDGTWVGVTPRGSAGEATGWVLVSRHGSWPELGIADCFWEGDGAALAEVLHGAAKWGRANGFPSLTISALDGGEVGAALRRAGFIPRAVRTSLLARACSGGSLPEPQQCFLNALLASVW